MENFKGAAIRHFLDTDLLHFHGCYDNAGHLIGFSAECAIKHKIASLGGQEPNLALHIPRLIPMARKRFNNREHAGLLALMDKPLLSGWDVNNRYSSSGHIKSKDVTLWLQQVKQLFRETNIRAKMK